MYTFFSLSLSFSSHSSYHMTMHNFFFFSFYPLITRASSLSAMHYMNFHLIFRKFTPFVTEMKYFVPLWLTNILLLRLMNTLPSTTKNTFTIEWITPNFKYDFTFIFYSIFPFFFSKHGTSTNSSEFSCIINIKFLFIYIQSSRKCDKTKFHSNERGGRSEKK